MTCLHIAVKEFDDDANYDLFDKILIKGKNSKTGDFLDMKDKVS